MNITEEARKALEGERVYRHVTAPNIPDENPVTVGYCLRHAARLSDLGKRDEARVWIEAAKLVGRGE